jgi:hypothetical protein
MVRRAVGHGQDEGIGAGCVVLVVGMVLVLSVWGRGRIAAGKMLVRVVVTITVMVMVMVGIGAAQLRRGSRLVTVVMHRACCGPVLLVGCGEKGRGRVMALVCTPLRAWGMVSGGGYKATAGIVLGRDRGTVFVIKRKVSA